MGDRCGESGPGARPMKKEWVISIRESVPETTSAFFFKQWGGVRKRQNGRILDSRTYDEYPNRVSRPIPERAECILLAEDFREEFSGGVASSVVMRMAS